MQAFSQYWQRTFESLNVRNYRIYFFSQAISLSGNWVQLIAQAWLILQLKDSGALLGLVTGLQFLPMLIIGPWAGAVIDRFSKRKILYITQSVAGVVALTLGTIVALGIVQIWMILALSLIIGLVNAFDHTCRQTMVADLVDKTRLQNAIALTSLEANAARIIGPALGAICIALFSMAGCFFINAVSFVCSLVGLYMLRESEFQPNTLDRTPGRSMAHLREGLDYIKNHPVPRAILLMMVLVGTLACEFFITLPLLAKHTFNGDSSTYASFTIALGLGAVLGGLYVAGKPLLKKVGSLGMWALCFGTAMLALSIAPSYTAALCILIVVGATQLILTVTANAMIMASTKAQMRGRVNAWWAVIFMGSTPIGGPLVGWIAEHSTPGMAIAVGGFAVIVAGLWAMLSTVSNATVVLADAPQDS